MRLALSLAAAAAIFCIDVPSSRAQYYGDAPWCAVVEVGTGAVEWLCQYRSVEECAPHVVAGDRGFCNLNPYSTGSQGVAPLPHRKRYAHRHGY